MTVVTIDTNVWYQALRSYGGASYAILELARQRALTVALSVSVFTEYEDVLLRTTSLRDMKLSVDDVQEFFSFLVVIGTPYKIYYRWRPNLRDEKDNIFVELAVASNSQFLITNNIRDFTRQNELLFDDYTVVTPAQFMAIWRRQNE